MSTQDRCLYLVRHGATDENLARPYRLQGQRIDPPLNELGRAQAARAAAVLRNRPIRQAFASPLRRAAETAELIAGEHRVAVRKLTELIECDVGRWEGLTWEEARRRDPEAFGRFMADPAAFPYAGGESFQQVHDRVVPALMQLMAECTAGDLLVVTHNIVCRVFLASLLGLPLRNARALRLDNGGISVIALPERSQPLVQTINSAFHLADLHVPDLYSTLTRPQEG